MREISPRLSGTQRLRRSRCRLPFRPPPCMYIQRVRDPIGEPGFKCAKCAGRGRDRPTDRLRLAPISLSGRTRGRGMSSGTFDVGPGQGVSDKESRTRSLGQGGTDKEVRTRRQRTYPLPAAPLSPRLRASAAATDKRLAAQGRGGASRRRDALPRIISERRPPASLPQGCNEKPSFALPLGSDGSVD
jgi:hypothetical protein